MSSTKFTKCGSLGVLLAFYIATSAVQVDAATIGFHISGIFGSEGPDGGTQTDGGGFFISKGGSLAGYVFEQTVSFSTDTMELLEEHNLAEDSSTLLITGTPSRLVPIITSLTVNGATISFASMGAVRMMSGSVESHGFVSSFEYLEYVEYLNYDSNWGSWTFRKQYNDEYQMGVGGGGMPVSVAQPLNAGGPAWELRGEIFYGTSQGSISAKLLGISAYSTVSGEIFAVPEPKMWALMLAGFGAVGVGMRRRKAVVQLTHAPSLASRLHLPAPGTLAFPRASLRS